MAYMSFELDDLDLDMAFVDDFNSMWYEVEPIVDFYRTGLSRGNLPAGRSLYATRRAIRLYKKTNHRFADRLHRTTGKCSEQVIVATLVCIYQDYIADWEELSEAIYEQLDDLYKEIEGKKDSALRTRELEKFQRYRKVIEHNRKIFYK